MKPSNLRELIEAVYDGVPILFADGFDDAIIGIETNTHKVCYDIDKCLEILIERDGMSYEEAHEYFYYNVSAAYVGEFTPLWIHTDIHID